MIDFNLDYVDGFTVHQIQDKVTKQVFYRFGEDWLVREDDTTYGVCTNFRMVKRLDEAFQEWLDSILEGGKDG